MIWDPNLFNANRIVERDSFIAIKGFWKDVGTEIILVNIYGPHSDSEKRKMWNDLNDILKYDGAMWALFGDFNEVRYSSERENTEFCERRAKLFNDFIKENSFLDLPLGGRTDDDINFGPKPVKVFDEWLMQEDSFDINKTTWNKNTNSSKPDCIFRDKLKLVKQELKRWYSTSHGKLKTEIEELTCVVTKWEKKA
ncbi:uncharacterized protein [Rutidosis leptorrhynchoides]|uniref:uncharacterized protein n=1 Tax=Rutidosis leptorrhynchoides TaxID=125765 RepID=UPI003A98D808